MHHLARLSLVALALVLPRAARAAHELGVAVHRSSTLGPTVAADLGVRWVRIDLDWDVAQPGSASPDFSEVDAAVDAARAKQLAIVLVIAGTPAWASAQNSDTTHRNDVPTTTAFAAFVRLAAQRYKDRVTTYELWNEPNLAASFEGTPKQYVDAILVPGADAVHAACPACQVLNGGLSTAYSSGWDAWLDAILVAAQDKIDGIAGHIFAGFPEDDPKYGTSEDSFLNVLDVRRVVTTAGVTFTGPRSLKDVLVEHACTKPFWLTATGSEAAPGDAAALARQKAYVRHVLEKAALRPFWTRTIFADAIDAPAPTTRFGLASDAGATYTKKPAFDVLQLGATSVTFGGTAPACSDGLDNDEDGKIDFPDDDDCFDPTGGSEGPFSLPDLATISDGGTRPVDGGGSLGGTGGGGSSVDKPPVRGCSMGGPADAVVLSGLLLVLVAWTHALRTRRR